jgi:hypothetical protein
MRKKLEWEWQQLDGNTYRAKVLKGWLVLHTNSISVAGNKKTESAISESMQFISDIDHEWMILPPRQEEVKVQEHEVPY